MRRYGCDPRRLYEIWEGKRFPATRAKALELFEARYPACSTGSISAPTSGTPGRPIPASYRCSLVAAAALTEHGTSENGREQTLDKHR